MKHTRTDEIARQTLDIIPLVMQVMASEMRSTGHQVANGHLRLLGQLAEKSYTLTELAEQLSVTAPTMSNTINAMENRGWVTRTRSTEDRRVVMIELTNEGLFVLNDIQDKTRQRISELLEPINSEQKELLLLGLTILKQTFEVGLFHPRHSHKD